MHMVATAADVMATAPSPCAIRAAEGTGVALPDRGTVLPIRQGPRGAGRQGGRNPVARHAAGRRAHGRRPASRAGHSPAPSPTRASPSPSTKSLSAASCAITACWWTVEEGSTGGFGAQVLHFLANNGLLRPGLDIRTMTLPDVFRSTTIRQSNTKQAGLAASDIARVVATHFVRRAQARGLMNTSYPPLEGGSKFA